MKPQDPTINTATALEQLDWIRGLARSLVRDASLADDITQETWLAAQRRPAGAGAATKGWLARVVRNAVRQEHRRSAIRREHEERTRMRDEAAATDEVVERAHTQRMLVDAVLALEAPFQRVILLRYFEGLAPREIARRQDTPVATVKTRLRRGLAQLREALDQRSGGERATWMSAITALAAPVDHGIGTGTLVIGGMAMGTMMKASAAVAVAAACVYFVTRTPREGSPPVVEVAGVAPVEASEDLADALQAPLRESTTEATATDAVRRGLVAEEPTGGVVTADGANVLRVVLEGISEEDAPLTMVTLRGLHSFDGWGTELGHAWPCEGLASEFELDPVLASLARRDDLRQGQLEVAVHHPHYLGARSQLTLTGNEEQASGQRIHEVRVQLVRPEFWPEFTLDVLDAHTRAHLEGVELRIASGPGASRWGRNNPSNLLAEGLSSPIELMGGREPEEATVAGMALSPVVGEAPQLVELARRWLPGRGVGVSARAPGYAWSSTSIDVSKGERELLLEPATTLEVRLTNMQLERYAALGTVPMLCVYRIRDDGGNQYAHFERLDEALESEGLRLDSLAPGGYRVVVELGGGSWPEHPVLASRELAGALALAAGETRELVLVLEEPPAPPERANLGGVISFPAPSTAWAEEQVRLHLYFQPTQRWRKPDYDLPLADLQRAGGSLPSWSFLVEDLPVGKYRLQLMPFLKVWMIDLEASGAEDLQLTLPELAEVLVETVDGLSGERVPREVAYYRSEVLLPDQRQHDFTKAETEEPGRFRFWTAPGPVMVWPKFPSGADRDPGSGEVFQLRPGFQTVRLELEPSYAMRFEFREGGVALPVGDPGMYVMRNIRAVDHEGRVTRDGLQSTMHVLVSGPGLYEISFEDLDKERYHPLPPRLVEVRAGELAEVIVELNRK